MLAVTNKFLFCSSSERFVEAFSILPVACDEVEVDQSDGRIKLLSFYSCLCYSRKVKADPVCYCLGLHSFFYRDRTDPDCRLFRFCFFWKSFNSSFNERHVFLVPEELVSVSLKFRGEQ